MSAARLFWLAAAQSYVGDCCARATSVRASELASRTERTPVQLAKEFQAAVGARVKDHLQTLQIERAKELLRSTTSNTEAIAAAAGFGTTRSFYRAFRRSTGLSPTQYRKEMSLAPHSGRN